MTTKTTESRTVDLRDAGPADHEIHLTRRRVDNVLVALGAVLAVVLLIAGALLTWGANFSSDYVSTELASQNISFPAAESLEGQGRTDLVGYAGQQVTTGGQAEAYASYIGGHIEGIADGMTYAELGGPERAAGAAVDEAIASGAPAAQIEELTATADGISAQRESIFRGEMLRGALLSTYAWSVIGQIASYASIAAFIAAGVMGLLVALGLVHMRRMTN